MELLSTVDPLRYVGPAITVLVASVILRWGYHGYQHRMRFRRLKSQGMPMMKHSPIFGHLPAIGDLLSSLPGDAHFDYMGLLMKLRWKELFPDCKECPPVAYLDMWPFSDPMIVSMNSCTTSQFTQDVSLPKGEISKSYLLPFTKLLDLGSSEGTQWKVSRKRLSPAFSAGAVTENIPMLVGEVGTFTDNLKKMAGKNGDWGAPFQLEEIGMRLTLDVMGRFLLDTHMNEQSGELSPFSSALINTLSWLRAFSGLADVLFLLNPWRRLRLWYNNRIMDDFILFHFKQRLNDTSRPIDKLEKKKFLRLFISSFQEETGPNKMPNPQLLDAAVQQTKHFFFAGHDTTASTICWVIHCLGHHPEALKKLRAELDTVLGPGHSAESVANRLRETPSLVNSLVYTNAVIKETLRVHTNVGTLRQGLPTFELYGPPGTRYEGMKFPTEGCTVLDASWAIHRDPEVWARADEFVPERWLVTDEKDPLHPPPNTFRPFELGPRDCIGQHLSIVEVKLILALVLKELDVEEAWEEWDAVQGTTKKKKETVFGTRCYQVNATGTPHVKDKMPVHIRLRA